MVVGEFVKESIEDLPCDGSGGIDRVIAIVDDFWFDNGDETGGLTFFGIFGEN